MASNPEEAKSKALELALTQIEKQYGRESIMKLGEKASKISVESLPTGALSLDLALGIGGLPRGRVTEIYGPESSGKTTLALHAIAEAQKIGGRAAFIDAEHAMDPAYAEALGVDCENLLISQPDSGEQALEITEKLIRSGALDVIVIDSVAALVPQAEIEGEMGASRPGLQARLMSQALRKLTAAISQTKTCLIFINQIRHKIGVMFGSPETTTGGLALKFYASVRLDIRRIENLKKGDVFFGSRCRVKVVKNKVAPPYRQALFDMIHGYGISHTGCLLDMGVEHGFVEKSGSWFLCGETRLGQGRENAKAFLQDNPKLAADIEKQLREKVLMKPADKKAQDAKKDAPETMPVAKKDEAPVKPAAKKKAAVK